MGREKTRTDKFLLNVVFSALLQIVTIITGFITPRLMLRYFGSEINGLTTSITQYISYIALIEAGLGNAAVFSLYKPLAEKDIAGRDAVISAARIAYRNTGIIFTLLAVLLAAVYPLIAGTEALPYLQTSVLVLVLCMNGVLNLFVMAKYRALLSADQNSFIISAVSANQLLVHMFIVIIALRFTSDRPWSVVLVRALGVLSIVISAFILPCVVRLKYGKIDFRARADKKAMNKRGDAMFMQVMGVVQNSAPAVLLTSLSGLSVVSVYSVYNMVVGTMSTCLSVFSSGLAAGFGQIKAGGDEALLRRTTELYRVAVFFIVSVLYSVMLVMLVPFVSIYTAGITDENYVLPGYALIIALYGLLASVESPYGMLVYSLGKYKEIRIPILLKTVIVVGMGALLTHFFGLVGLAVALCASELFMILMMMWFVPKYLLPISVPTELLRVGRILAVAAASYGVSHMIGYVPDGYISWIITAALYTVAVAVVTLAVNYPFEKDVYREIVWRIKTYMKSKFGTKTQTDNRC